MKVDKNTKVAEWYQKTYPGDDLGEQIDDKVTFQQVIECIEDDPGTFYSLIGVSDSVVRERIFTAVAGLVHKPYQMVYDRWLDNDNPSIVEMIQIDETLYCQIVFDYLCEGYSFTEALCLIEDTITPETVTQIELTPAYKRMQRDIDYFFNACDDVINYRDTDFKDHPIEALEDEADFCSEVANFLSTVRLKGFDPKATQEIMSATAEDMEYLQNSAKRLKNILKKQDDSVYLKPDGSVNPNTKQKPGEYARRALTKIRDFFARLGQEWDYDLDFYKKNPEMFADLDAILKNREDKEKRKERNQNKKLALAAESNWKPFIKDLVHAALKEGVYDRSALLEMKSCFEMTKEQCEYFDKYVYYIIEG